ncbi:hypothetical protein H6G33_17305 [Calothrix sp. FACHB-1219]|uniref:hypothetical protein n=1 Tax=unclassified Calothrix TaxID=2619626 RepID=UPI0016834E62|nr:MULTISPECIES: hypothetical protein [unclassified Calothrix]MBD2203191.1 hypothetical protein [Calothrix sp. FACHB-168]MBD2218791.1 hypothetical protein [Calothrix sp. FACHB-1219]
MSDQKSMLEVYLHEYEKLKEEQAQRIGFRDNLLYVTLGVFGAVVSFSVTNKANYYALLVIPWVSLILGWNYLVNDEKISAIGKYIRHKLTEKIKEQTGHPEIESIFGWETVHRSDKNRKRRKIEQLIIDEITFVLSGVIALVAFWLLVSNPPVAVNILGVLELILLLILAIEIIIYADLGKGK